MQSVNRIFLKHTLFLIFRHFQKYLNPQVRTKKLVNNVFYHSCPLRSRLASLGYIFLYFFKLLRVLSFQNACWIFSDLYIPTCVRKFFQIMLFTFLENHWILLSFFTLALVPHSKLLVEFFENRFPLRQKGWRKLWFAVSKFNQKIWRWLGTLVYFHLVWLQFF